MGRPRSATFRTLDVVGIDVFKLVADNLHEAAPEQWERDAFAVPPIIDALIERGALGEKTRQGFFKREKVDGETQIFVLDPETMEYVPRRRLDAPSLAAVRGIDDSPSASATCVNADDKAGRFAWEVMKRTLLYTRRGRADMADDIVSIDNAMRWGFGWELGPFQMWDAIGLREVHRAHARPKARTFPNGSPGWPKARRRRFTQWTASGRRTRRSPDGRAAAEASDPARSTSVRLKAREKVVRALPGATMYDMGDGVALVDFHSPKQAIGGDLMQMLQFAMAEGAQPTFEAWSSAATCCPTSPSAPTWRSFSWRRRRANGTRSIWPSGSSKASIRR